MISIKKLKENEYGNLNILPYLKLILEMFNIFASHKIFIIVFEKSTLPSKNL